MHFNYPWDLNKCVRNLKLKLQKKAEWMRLGWVRRYFYCSQLYKAAEVLRPGWQLKCPRRRGLSRAESDICIYQCFIITAITSSHAGSRTRHIGSTLLSLTGRGRALPPRHHLITSCLSPHCDIQTAGSPHHNDPSVHFTPLATWLTGAPIIQEVSDIGWPVLFVFSDLL